MLRLLPSLVAGWSALAIPGSSPSRCLAVPPGTITVSQPAGQPLTRANHKIYVADELRGTVSIIDAAANRVIKTISLAYAHGDMGMVFAPHNIQASPDGRTVWVTAPPPMNKTECGDGDSLPPPPMPPGMGEQLVVIDPFADTILTRIELFPLGADTMLHLAHVVLDADARYAYVSANSADQVIRIDVRTFAEVNRYSLGKGRGPHGMRFCGDKLVVANMAGKSLSVIDPADGTVGETPVGGSAVQIACSRNGESAFATLYDTREVVRYEVASRAVTRIALPEEARGPVQLYIAPTDLKLYVADQGVLFGQPAHNTLYEIDVAAGKVSGAVRVGRAPHGVVLSEDGKFAYVTNLWDANISVVDLQTLKEVATVGVGEGPNGITYWNGVGATTSASRD